MGRFTQAELIEALNQVAVEKNGVYDMALRAASWLSHKCWLSVYPAVCEYSIESIRLSQSTAPYLPTYFLAIQQGVYDSPSPWLVERIEPALSADPPIGIPRSTPSFILKLGTDEGFPRDTRYYCYVSYVDPGFF